jgi:outer membrane protein assembly factor BamB
MKYCKTLSTIGIVVCTIVPAGAENWSRFRGENGTGVSDQTGVPTEWKASDPAWQIDLPGTGHSSPCIWGKSLFVTSATDEGQRRLLLSIDADTGVEKWRRELALQSNPRHQKNSWATSSPATDGTRVYVTFADEQSYIIGAWDFAGEQVWRVDLGEFEGIHGLGVSPIVVNGLVVVANDQLGPSSIEAFDAMTGDRQWRTPRTSGSASYVTPVVFEVDGRPVLICVSITNGVSCLDLSNGMVQWETGELSHRTVASPVISNGIVLATCGGGGQGKHLIGVDLHSTGDRSRVIFERRQRLPYVPTPVVWNNLAFLWGDSGVVSCLEMPSGRNLWTNRVDGNYSSSPICINGHIFCVAENGVVTVIRADRDFELLGRTPLGDPCHASPAVANEHLYLRTFHRLIAIKAN